MYEAPKGTFRSLGMRVGRLGLHTDFALERVVGIAFPVEYTTVELVEGTFLLCGRDQSVVEYIHRLQLPTPSVCLLRGEDFQESHYVFWKTHVVDI